MDLPEHVRVGQARERFGESGKLLGYVVEVWHDGLNEHRALRDRSLGVLQSKANSQIQKWVEKWERVEAKRQEQERREHGKDRADADTSEATSALAEAEALLQHTLSINDAVDWSSLKSFAPFKYDPANADHINFAGEHQEPVGYVRPNLPREPTVTDEGIAISKTFFRRLIPALGKKMDMRQAENLRAATKRWQTEVSETKQEDAARQRRLEAMQSEFAAAKVEFEQKQAGQNAAIDDLERRWRLQRLDAVEEHAELVLNQSNYPDWIKVDFDLAYNEVNGSLVVDYELPDTTQIPTLQRVTYMATREEFNEKHISETQKKRFTTQ